ncbi:MAG: hypothetical protein ACR2NP_06040 [Pirellulaceae bacterium]
MFRYLLATIILGATLSLSGCVTGPVGCGDYCGSGCGDYCGGGCGDYCYDGCHPPHAHYGGPLDCVREWRRNLTCGSGCCEVYHDEWCSTPPDCCDPCCFDYPAHHPILECCGCGVPGCQGGCSVQPIRRMCSFVGSLYGRRFCEGCGHGFSDCCCEDPYSSYGSGCDCCGDCGGGGCAEPYPVAPQNVPQPYGGLEEIGAYESGGSCANGSCNLASRGRAVRSPNTSVARQQMLQRRTATAAGAPVAGTATATVQPQSAPSKFYRQASRIPQQRQQPSSFQR